MVARRVVARPLADSCKIPGASWMLGCSHFFSDFSSVVEKFLALFLRNCGHLWVSIDQLFCAIKIAGKTSSVSDTQHFFALRQASSLEKKFNSFWVFLVYLTKPGTRGMNDKTIPSALVSTRIHLKYKIWNDLFPGFATTAEFGVKIIGHEAFIFLKLWRSPNKHLADNVPQNLDKMERDK